MSTVDDLARSLAAGRLSRRGFLVRAAELGLSAGAAVALLEACGKESTQASTQRAADVSVAVLLPTSGDFAQNCVSREVPVLIVDAFEVIDVNHQTH